MLTQRSLLAILCLIMAITVSGLILSRITLTDQHQTVSPTATTNPDRMLSAFLLCADIAELTGNSNPCRGYYVDPSVTSSPVPGHYSSLSDSERAATMMTRRYAVTATLGVACPSLAALQVT